MSVEVFPVRGRDVYVSVSVLIRWTRVYCVFFRDGKPLRLVHIFGRKRGAVVPAASMRDARMRALDALADFDKRESDPPLAFTVDVAMA